MRRGNLFLDLKICSFKDKVRSGWMSYNASGSFCLILAAKAEGSQTEFKNME